MARGSNIRIWLLTAVIWFGGLTLFITPAFAQQSTPPPKPTNEFCLACHGVPGFAGSNGRSLAVDPERFGASIHGPLTLSCVDCHTDLQALRDLPHPEKLARVNCGTCHASAETAYSDSIHGHAVRKSGLIVAPNCKNCHGSHDVRPKTDPLSRVNRVNIPATCGSCHEGILTQYANGVHGAAVAKGSRKAPICTDCHTAHGIQRADVSSWQLDVIGECGTCHVNRIETYRDTFHGQVTSLGFVRVATCAACHGAHAILPARDPRSMTSKERVLSTCQQCHPNATAGFAQYDPHADKHDRGRNPVLFYSSQFMKWLLFSVFAFFGLHAALWFPRGFAERRKARQPEQQPPTPDEKDPT